MMQYVVYCNVHICQYRMCNAMYVILFPLVWCTWLNAVLTWSIFLWTMHNTAVFIFVFGTCMYIYIYIYTSVYIVNCIPTMHTLQSSFCHLYSMHTQQFVICIHIMHKRAAFICQFALYNIHIAVFIFVFCICFMPQQMCSYLKSACDLCTYMYSSVHICPWQLNYDHRAVLILVICI